MLTKESEPDPTEALPIAIATRRLCSNAEPAILVPQESHGRDPNVLCPMLSQVSSDGAWIPAHSRRPRLYPPFLAVVTGREHAQTWGGKFSRRVELLSRPGRQFWL